MTKPHHETPPGDPALLSLDALAAALPKPDPHHRDAIVDEHAKPALVAIGRQIASSRVITDSARIYALAHQFWSGASEAQRAELVGFSPDLLSLCVDEARKLQAADAATHGSAAATDEQRRLHTAKAADVTRRATARRDHAATVLRSVAGKSHEWLPRIEAALANAAEPGHLARSLQALAAIGHDAVTSKDKAVAARVKLARLDKKYLTAVETAATEVGSAAEAVAGRSKPVTQGDLDLADGINLHLLSTVIEAFEAAHDVDATIPRLAPIATRRLLGNHAKTKAKPVPAPAPATP